MRESFEPTHLIIHNDRRIPVRMVDGACYTKDEFTFGDSADWEYSEDDGLTFQGKAPSGDSDIIEFDLDEFEVRAFPSGEVLEGRPTLELALASFVPPPNGMVQASRLPVAGWHPDENGTHTVYVHV